MSWMERFPVLVWAGAALLGRVAGEIMIEDPAVVGWLGAATAHHLHEWAKHIGAIFVVAVGLFLINRRRPLAGDERLAAPGLLIWIAGEITIKQSLPADNTLALVAAYLVLASILVVGYGVFRRVRMEPEEV
jgi:hypothetical protein